jgi:hypothetical protein
MRRAALVLLCSCGGAPLLGNWSYSTLVTLGSGQQVVYDWHIQIAQNATADTVDIAMGACTFSATKSLPTKAALPMKQTCAVPDGGTVPLFDLAEGPPSSVTLDTGTFEVNASDELQTSFSGRYAVGAMPSSAAVTFTGRGQR